MTSKNKDFEEIFFLLIAVFEGLATILYLILWGRAKVQRDLTSVNKFDLQSTCFLVFFRLLWAIGLSIFILSKIKSVETRDYPYQRESEKHDARA